MVQRKPTKLVAVNGRRARITRLDNCGRLIYGDNAVVVTKGFVSAQASTNTASKDAVELKNADGERVINIPEQVSFSNYGLEITFTEVDPELFAIVTGNRLIFDAFGNPVGVASNSKVVSNDIAFALEVWTGAPAAGCVAGAGVAYGYVLYPFLSGGVRGDLQFSEGAITFSVTGVSSKDGNQWGVGPYKVVPDASSQPAALPAALDPNDHDYLISTVIAPPDPTTGSRPQLDPTATAITAITKSNTGRAYTFGATPAVNAGVGTWWDFGDGTWDYVQTAGSAVNKTYTKAGTYNVQASTNGTWVVSSTTVS